MPTLEEVRSVDRLGFTKFGEKQCKAMVEMLKRTGKLNSPPPKCSGQGIVIVGGGKYLSWAWVVAKTIRALGCQLPIQVWHLGPSEMPAWARKHFAALDAQPVDALPILTAHPHRMLSQYLGQKKWTYAGWLLKNFAIEHCPFEQVVYLDSDCFPAVNPEQLLALPEVKETGSLFFSDIAHHRMGPWAFIYCGLLPPDKEWEAGQKVIHKTKGWMGLRWANWMGEHADVWFNMVHGDKELDNLAFHVAKVPFLISKENSWEGWGISQKWNGVGYFRHMMAAKRGEHPLPPEIQELFWEFQALSP